MKLIEESEKVFGIKLPADCRGVQKKLACRKNADGVLEI